MKKLILLGAFLFATGSALQAQTKVAPKPADHSGHDHSDPNHKHDHSDPNHKHDHAKPAEAKPAIPASANTASAFKWEKTEHDFGDIKQGVPATAEFKFTNVGKEPIIISEAKAACGCTVPDYTKDPVRPGGTGTVKATYNAAAAGAFNKTVTVTSNVSDVGTVLYIKGTVIQKEE